MKLNCIKLRRPTPEKLLDEKGRCDLIHVGMTFQVVAVNRTTGEIYLDINDKFRGGRGPARRKY